MQETWEGKTGRREWIPAGLEDLRKPAPRRGGAAEFTEPERQNGSGRVGRVSLFTRSTWST